MIRVIETESQRVYNVGYAYPYYDEYTDRSATLRSSKLVWASSPEEAIQKLDDMKDKIYNDNLSMAGYPYDFEILGSWDDMNEFKSQFPTSNIELVECEVPEDESDKRYILVREALEDDPETADQEFSSADTSINSSKLPALFKMVKFDNGSLNLDYGGGKFDNVAEYLNSEYNATNLVYDPYNRSNDHNREVLQKVRKNGGADTVTCSNVLNVIKEPEARLAVIKNCKNYLKPGGTAYFTVYTGDNSGIGRATKSGYQLNRDTKDYLDEIKQVFNNVTRKGKLIIAR